MKAFCDPHLYRMFMHVLDVMRSQEDPQVVFGPKMTSEQLGALFHDWSRSHPSFVRTDFSKFDCHFRSHMFEAIFDFLEEMGLDPEVAAVEKRAGTAGVSRHGVKYTAPTSLCSGDGATSLIGTLGNWFVVSSFILLHSTDLSWKWMFAGDDGLGFLSSAEPWFATAFKDHCRRLGFVVDVLVTEDPWHATFCSKLFWPAYVSGHPSNVLGPLPGRQLGKVAWTVSLSDGNFRGAMLSLNHDAAHVPFIRRYIPRMLELTRGQESRAPKHLLHQIRSSEAHELHPDAWLWVHERYGLSESDEHDYAAWLSTIRALPCVATNLTIQRMVDIDANDARLDERRPEDLAL